ncbi:flippase [Aeribacillus pallidus]|uniref:flippase n=1 Tax=Aeribacillus pallidus TaxID=33936 RepID=UPI000B92B975|nr:flippase [Aeribacillus pallidus]
MRNINFIFKEILGLANKVGFIHLLSANILIQIAGFGGQIFLTRILSVEDIGTIKILQSYLNILVIIASLGLNTSVLKLCSENINEKDRISIFNVSVIFTLISSLILIFIVNKLVTVHNIKVNNLLSVYVYLIPILSLTNLIIVYLQSQQKIKTMSLIQSYSKVFIVVFSTAFAYGLGLEGYIYSLVILNLFSFILILLFIRREIKFASIRNVSIDQLKKIFSIALFSLGANLVGVLLSNLNIIIANILTNDSKEIGYYGIAQLIITTMMIIPSTLGQIMVPKISKVSNNIEDVKYILKTYQKRNTILAFSVALIAGIFAPLIIPFVFGENYIKSVYYFEILLLGFIFWSLYSPKGITLMSVGRSDANFYVSLISVTLNFILNYLLIIRYGMLGAAVANTIVYFITIFTNDFFFRKFYLKKW